MQEKYHMSYIPREIIYITLQENLLTQLMCKIFLEFFIVVNKRNASSPQNSIILSN